MHTRLRERDRLPEGKSVFGRPRDHKARQDVNFQIHPDFHISMTMTMTIRLDDNISGRLDAPAEVTQRNKSFLAAEAIRECVNLNEWQLQEAREALHEADAGDFASDEEVDALASKWNLSQA